MILYGQIEKVSRRELKDKVTGQVGHLWQIVISDKTKPSDFRSSTFFLTYLSDEKFAAAFSSREDAEDAKVTLLASELAPANALIKCKGQLVKGHLTFEELAKIAAASGAPQQVAGVTVDRHANGAAPVAGKR